MNERVYVKSIYIKVYIGCNIYPITVQNTPNPVQYIPNPGAKYTQYKPPPVQYIPNLMQDRLNMRCYKCFFDYIFYVCSGAANGGRAGATDPMGRWVVRLNGRKR